MAVHDAWAPYDTYVDAVKSHYRFVRKLGREPQLAETAV